MSERTTLEIIAPTVEEAIQQGLEQLGLTADAVSVEVLDSGSKGLFGLGGRQVRVRLSVNPPPQAELPASQPPAAPRQAKPTPPKKNDSKPRAKETRPQVEKKAQEPKPEPKQAAPSPAPKPAADGHDLVLNTAEEVVSKLIFHMGLTAQVSAHYDEADDGDHRAIQVDVRGEDLSALIGRRAETLAAFQQVASLIVGKQTQQWVQVVVDVEGYRARREKQIRQLANRMADQVTKTGRKATMEPMTSSERRVVHIELRGHPAVKTESTGEDPYRKVVIVPKE